MKHHFRLLGTLLFSLFFAVQINAQCATSGTISADCTDTNLTVNGSTLTVNPGVTITLSGTLTVRAGGTLNGTGAIFNIGGLAETNGSTNQINGGTYNTGSFSTGNGGAFTITGATIAISPSGAVSIAGSTTNINTSTFTGVTNWTTNVTTLGMNGTSITATGSIGLETATIVGGTFTAGTNLDIGSGVTSFSGSTLNIGTSNASTGVDAITLNGGADLSFTNSSAVTITGDVNGGSGADVLIDNSSVTVSGNFDNVGNGSVTVQNGGALSVSGDFANNGGGNVSSDSGGSIAIEGDFNNTGGGNTDVDGGSIAVGGTFTGTTPTGDAGDCDGGGGGCCGVGCEPLPVTLTSFTSTQQGDRLLLSWQTQSELNNNHFTLERSFDGINFSEIARVSGAGNSSSASSYSYFDNASFGADFVYYRLSQTDFDGTHKNLKVISVGVSVIASDIQVYPNPARNNSTIQIAGAPLGTNWSLSSISGQVIRKGSFLESFEIRTQGLKTGTYLLKLSNEESSVIKRVVVN